MREAVTDSGNMYGIGQINATVQLQFVGLVVMRLGVTSLALNSHLHVETTKCLSVQE